MPSVQTTEPVWWLAPTRTFFFAMQSLICQAMSIAYFNILKVFSAGSESHLDLIWLLYAAVPLEHVYIFDTIESDLFRHRSCIWYAPFKYWISCRLEQIHNVSTCLNLPQVDDFQSIWSVNLLEFDFSRTIAYMLFYVETFWWVIWVLAPLTDALIGCAA